MSTVILYTKKYPREWEFADADPHNSILGCKHQDACAALAEIEASTKYIPIRSRKKKWKHFVAEAIRISSFYELDLQIKRCDSYVSAEFVFPVGGYIDHLQPLFHLADSYHIMTDSDSFEIILTLDYYTHKVYLRGRQIAPNMHHGFRYALYSRWSRLCHKLFDRHYVPK